MTDELYFDRNAEGRFKLVKMGKCMGRDYAIVSYGTHPCAYVSLLEDDTRDFEEGDALEAVNGGITFGIGRPQSDRLPPFGPKSVEAPYGVIGWDYAHCLDYSQPQGIEELSENLVESYRELNEGRKKWTLGEIEDEVFAMCKWLNGRMKKEEGYTEGEIDFFVGRDVEITWEDGKKYKGFLVPPEWPAKEDKEWMLFVEGDPSIVAIVFRRSNIKKIEETK